MNRCCLLRPRGGCLLFVQGKAGRAAALHSLHPNLTLPCWQMYFPSQSLHSSARRPCRHICDPPQSLQTGLNLPCGQIRLPLQSLHWYLILPWLHRLLPPQSLHKVLRFPCGHFFWFDVLAVASMPSRTEAQSGGSFAQAARLGLGAGTKGREGAGPASGGSVIKPDRKDSPE
jgi:hypothetical protein